MTLAEEAIARPRVVGCMLDEFRLDGISVHVTDQRDQVSIFLDEEGLVAALKEMSDPPVSPVEPLGVGRMHPGHDPGKRERAGSNGQVDVIGHEAVREESEAEPLAVVGDSSEILLSIQIVSEHRTPLVSAGGDVVHGAGKFQPGRPRHGQRRESGGNCITNGIVARSVRARKIRESGRPPSALGGNCISSGIVARSVRSKKIRESGLTPSSLGLTPSSPRSKKIRESGLTPSSLANGIFARSVRARKIRESGRPPSALGENCISSGIVARSLRSKKIRESGLTPSSPADRANGRAAL